MEIDYKLEGDKLKIAVSYDKGFDADSDGEESLKAALTLHVEADGSEVLEELLKSNSLVAKAKEILEKIGIKA